jgi:hypothetical protein
MPWVASAMGGLRVLEVTECRPVQYSRGVGHGWLARQAGTPTIGWCAHKFNESSSLGSNLLGEPFWVKPLRSNLLGLLARLGGVAAEWPPSPSSHGVHVPAEWPYPLVGLRSDKWSAGRSMVPAGRKQQQDACCQQDAAWCGVASW